jgi:hypothetical protein
LTLLENLQTHRGDLIRLKTQLFWHGRGWDGNPDRICLILDAAGAAGSWGATRGWAVGETEDADDTDAAALLLIDGSPQWIRVVDADVEVL